MINYLKKSKKDLTSLICRVFSYMQTFISDYDLAKNAANLDGKRLFKQLLEGKQILDVLVNNKKAWSNHPAARQWRNYEIGLFWYLRSIWNECQKREIALDSKLFDQCYDIILGIKLGGGYIDCDEKNRKISKFILPNWWGRADILKSHRSRLKCKGLIDVYCAAIKKHFKIKKIDAWLKPRYFKTKNELRYDDAISLLNLWILPNKLKVDKNHYDKKEWKNIPFNLDYVWPV